MAKVKSASCCCVAKNILTNVNSFSINTHSKTPHSVPGVEPPKESQANISPDAAPKLNDTTKCRRPLKQLLHSLLGREDRGQSSHHLFCLHHNDFRTSNCGGHYWPTGWSASLLTEKASVKDTWKQSPGSQEGCSIPRYSGPPRRKPANKCSETITTPQRTNTINPGRRLLLEFLWCDDLKTRQSPKLW